MFKKSRVILLFSLLSISSTPALAGSFDITINNLGGLTASQSAIFATAEAFWEGVLPSIQDSGNLNLVIDASGIAIDGPGGILGQAGPTSGGTLGGSFIYVFTGVMQFDTADLAGLEGAGLLLDVILHEMAHVIGFGTAWVLNGVYVDESGMFTGANALAAYQAEFDPLATFVPVDIVSGLGTRNSHWAENWAGGFNELMTGFLDPPTFISDTTLASFIDIGYNRADEGQLPVPEPSTFLLLLTGLFVIGIRRTFLARSAGVSA